MAPLNSAVRQVRRALLVRDAAGLSDGQLLEWFLEQGEEAAFEALVRRHGPMVLGVCRRVLRHRHDAEDAFQATFLVLTRKAASIAKREMLAAWLYGVAYRIAVRAKAMSARRQTVTSDLSEVADPAGPEPAWDDLEPLLDQEISGLPARYRVPLVLCELEGRSRKEVARQLGIPEGTLSSRLARARDMLRLRLSRRGVSVGSAALAALLAGNASSATVPAQLLSATLKAAGLFVAGNGAAAGLSGKVAALAQAGLKGMLLERLRLAVILLIGVVLLGAGAAAGRRAFRMPADGRGACAGAQEDNPIAAVLPQADDADDEAELDLPGMADNGDVDDPDEFAERGPEEPAPETAGPPAKPQRKLACEKRPWTRWPAWRPKPWWPAWRPPVRQREDSKP